jgi:MFS family permease
MIPQNRLFLACLLALVTTSFGFIVRALLIDEWASIFNLTETQVGALLGAGLFPFAISIIAFSFIIDRVGYGWITMFGWIGHLVSAVLTVTARDFTQLYAGTLVFALANGAIEAVINPVTATLFPNGKTKYLNILHAGWPGGLVLGGILAISMGDIDWRWKVGLFVLPALFYGWLFIGQRFPRQERVNAGVSYREMLCEFGWGGALIVFYFAGTAAREVAQGIFGTNLPVGTVVALTVASTLGFAYWIRSFGRPLFVLLLLVMILLATTELGTDSWVAALMTPVLSDLGEDAGSWLLVYTSGIMFGLRFIAGSVLKHISPLGLLTACSIIAAVGLLWLLRAGAAPIAIFAAATLYGAGKTFFWPTTLGVVSELFPKGGALTLNAVSGVGMIAVGVLGSPLLGVVQDHSLSRSLFTENAELHDRVVGSEQTKFGLTYRPVDRSAVEILSDSEQVVVEHVRMLNNQETLGKISLLPATMALIFGGMVVYFRLRGGYRPVRLSESTNIESHKNRNSSSCPPNP